MKKACATSNPAKEYMRKLIRRLIK
uniref:Uncharacterized protein n=1 Tax=Anguilla anguilla TaxID=7936 RepID=A0A0E9UGM5_ANGAN